MQWLIDLVIEAIGIPPVLIDRGDPVNSDFIFANFTKDGNYHELDLSAIVPAGASGVAFTTAISATAVGKEINFTTHTNPNKRNISRMITQVAWLSIVADFIVPLNASRSIDYMVSAANVIDITLTVKGWWL